MFLANVRAKYQIRGAYAKELTGSKLLEFFHDINPDSQGGRSRRACYFGDLGYVEANESKNF